MKGRLPTEGVVSSLGPVVDLSAGGVRVLARNIPSGPTALSLRGMGIHVQLPGRLCWARRRGWFKYEAGFSFENLTAEQSRTLCQLSIEGRCRRSVVAPGAK